MLSNKLSPVLTGSRLPQKNSPKGPKTKYRSFLGNMSNIRTYQISPRVFHTNSVSQKLCHKQNATRGKNRVRKNRKFMSQML